MGGLHYVDATQHAYCIQYFLCMLLLNMYTALDVSVHCSADIAVEVAWQSYQPC
jgi:hypothetical protein